MGQMGPPGLGNCGSFVGSGVVENGGAVGLLFFDGSIRTSVLVKRVCVHVVTQHLKRKFEMEIRTFGTRNAC